MVSPSITVAGAVEDMDAPAERQVSDQTGRGPSRPVCDRRLPEVPEFTTNFYILTVADRLDILRTYD